MGESQNNSLGSPLNAEIVNSSTPLTLVPVSQTDGLVQRPPLHPTGILAGYCGLLGRRRIMVLACTVVGAILGFIITVPKLPVYRARTSLDIQNLNSDFMNMKDVAPTAGNDSNGSSEAYVQTQIKLLQSETLRTRTMKRMMGGAYPESLKRDDLWSGLNRTLHLTADEPLNKSALVKDAGERVVVKPLGVTRLVEVTCDSWNARFSADFCNALTSEFSETDREVRWSEAQKTSEWLSRQLADVRDNLAQSENRLEAATGATGLILRHGGDSVAAEKLDEIQAELMRAQGDRVTKQAQYKMSISAPPESLPTVLDNTEYRDSQIKLEDLRRQVAALVPPLTEANPKVRHLRAQITQVESSLASQKQGLLQRMKNEYEEAQHREALLAGAYSSQEKKVTVEQARDAKVSMLRHEVDSEQQLYQKLLQRVKEAGLASALQASTIRVVDAAQAPENAIEPRRTISTFVGMLLGMFGGIAVAFIRQKTDTVLRLPGDVPRFLALRELGVIPSAKKKPQELPAGIYWLPLRLLMMIGPTESASASRPNSMDLSIWKDHASLVSDAFRSVTYSILLAGQQNGRAKTYVISSPSMGEGKTTVTSNLGFALAQANRRVLVIDGDLRRPRLHEVMNVPNDIGLRDLLKGSIDLQTSLLEEYCRPTSLPNFWVITSGRGSEEPSSLLHSRRCQEVLDYLAGHFDIILIDSPPMLHLADARIFAGMATGAILVFRSRVTNRETAADARDLFLNDRVKLLGTILNDFDPGREGKNSYYRSYYAYRQDARAATRGTD
jgi:polysaccharide biosynthesis transport protein